jgi:quercetin dioxygenase-like cupin family protein
VAEVLTMPDGTTFELVRSPGDPERDPSEVVFTAQPDGPAPPPHIHPRQREVFTLEEGDFELLLDGSWRVLEPGESVTVEPGATHTYRNKGTRIARVRTVHEPGLSFDEYLRELHATISAHGSEKLTPAVATRLAVIWRRHSDTIKPGPLPIKIAFAILGRVGPLLGFRPSPASAARADQPAQAEGQRL